MIPKVTMNRLFAEFEPVKQSLHVCPAKVGAITRGIHSTRPDGVTYFRAPKGRTDFLFAALRYLDAIDSHDELLVAFGARQSSPRNSPAILRGVWRGVGSRGSVALSPKVRAIIDRNLAIENSEVVFIDNHRARSIRSLVSTFIDWNALTSSRSREVTNHDTRHAWLQILLGSASSMRWYHVDGGQMTESYFPGMGQV